MAAVAGGRDRASGGGIRDGTGKQRETQEALADCNDGLELEMAQTQGRNALTFSLDTDDAAVLASCKTYPVGRCRASRGTRTRCCQKD